MGREPDARHQFLDWIDNEFGDRGMSAAGGTTSSGGSHASST